MRNGLTSASLQKKKDVLGFNVIKILAQAWPVSKYAWLHTIAHLIPSVELSRENSLAYGAGNTGTVWTL